QPQSFPTRYLIVFFVFLQNPVQEWGEEKEDGVVYGVTLRREPDPSSPGPSETSSCCGFVQYRTCKVRRLKAATLDLLINHLLDSSSSQDLDYSRIFLSTYRTYTSTTALIELLFQSFPPCALLSLSLSLSSLLLTFIQTWLDEYSEDFRDPPLHPALCLLLDHLRISSAVHGGMRRALLNVAAGLDQGEEEYASEDSGCETSLDQGSIMDFSASSIAEQLTQMDSALFVKVVPYQCLGCVWSQRDKKENMSPTIRATITQFNALTNRVIVSLLSQSAEPRARIIEKWIKVAQECRRLKNFSSLKAILSALHSNAVYRLRKTWAAVSRDSMATFDNLWETFPDENCVLTNRELLVEVRKTHHSTSSAVVPYLGTFLTVLTMLDTALPDTTEVNDHFSFPTQEFDVLSQIRVLQASCSQYGLPKHPKISSFHSSYNNVSEVFSSSSSSLSTPFPSAASYLESPSGSPSDCGSDLCGTDPATAAARPSAHPSPHHKRSISMTSLPMYNRQVCDSCIIRVSVDLGLDNGNMYKSILLTSQDKTAQVIQRALEKHHLEHMNPQDFTLSQIMSQQKGPTAPSRSACLCRTKPTSSTPCPRPLTLTSSCACTTKRFSFFCVSLSFRLFKVQNFITFCIYFASTVIDSP
uniref:Ral guanine nucleotide dissociation stimulator-like 3a n=1 Tax=Xiphophorus couchianus TaxID=32473 RepID=A0A3B5M8M6_9TELE